MKNRVYLDRAPRIGDMVEVVNPGRHYSHMSTWAETHHLDKWRMGISFSKPLCTERRLLRVVNIGRHPSDTCTVVALYCSKYDEQYMFGEDGVRVVESIAEKLDLI